MRRTVQDSRLKRGETSTNTGSARKQTGEPEGIWTSNKAASWMLNVVNLTGSAVVAWSHIDIGSEQYG